jgi:ketosteroid isomerase-like protein
MIAAMTPATLATPATATDDAAIVAALDIEYQAAVEHNDATVMARILADDFVLVTGTGRRYSDTYARIDSRTTG